MNITCKKFNTKDSSGKESVLKMTKRLNAVVGINGGGFVDYGYGSDIPIGYVIKDNKVIWSPTNKKQNLIGFTNDHFEPTCCHGFDFALVVRKLTFKKLPCF